MTDPGPHAMAWSPLELLGYNADGRLLGDAEVEQDFALAALLVVYYFAFVSLFGLTTEKQKAWVVTSCSASTCTAFFFVALSLGEIALLPIDPGNAMDTPFSRFCSRFFRVTLLVDLGMGLAFYRSQLDPLTSWFHHIAYLLLMNWVISRRVCLIFSVFLVEEWPTFLLAIGSINKRFRNDLLFGGCFFTLRVAYHGMHFYSLFIRWTKESAVTVELLYMFRAMMVLTMALHLHWFSGWVRQQMRKLKQRDAEKQLKST